jgi:hypothetical protein
MRQLNGAHPVAVARDPEVISLSGSTGVKDEAPAGAITRPLVGQRRRRDDTFGHARLERVDVVVAHDVHEGEAVA